MVRLVCWSGIGYICSDLINETFTLGLQTLQTQMSTVFCAELYKITFPGVKNNLYRHQENCWEEPSARPRHPHREAMQHRQDQFQDSIHAWTNDYSRIYSLYFVFTARNTSTEYNKSSPKHAVHSVIKDPNVAALHYKKTWEKRWRRKDNTVYRPAWSLWSWDRSATNHVV